MISSFFCKLKDAFLSEGMAFILLLLSLVFLIIFIIYYLCCKNVCGESLGVLIVGIVTSVITIGNTILLYLTLQTQIHGNQTHIDISNKERFETIVFKLLDNYLAQIHHINLEAIILQDPPNMVRQTINGGLFFSFAFEQLQYLNIYFKEEQYLGRYDPSSDLIGYDYKVCFRDELDYDNHLRIKYMANVYGISKDVFERYKCQIESGEKTIKQVCYLLFYNRWGYTYDHYIRLARTIIEYIKTREEMEPGVIYMKTFKAYMSTHEQLFLNYHSSIDSEFEKTLQGTILFTEK